MPIAISKSARIAVWLLLAGLLMLPLGAAAQETDAAASARTEAELESLVSTLEDDKARAKLLGDLKALLAARKAAPKEAPRPTGIVGALSERVSRLSGEIAAGAGIIAEAPQLYAWIEEQAGEAESRERWLSLAWKLIVVILAGLIAELLARWLLSGSRRAVEGREADARWLRIVFLGGRTVLDVVPIAAFGAAAYAVLPLTGPGDTPAAVILVVVNASIVARAVLAVGRMVLAPRIEALRLFRIASADANYLYIWLRRLTNIGVYGFAIADGALLLGLTEAGHGAVQKFVGLILMLMFIVLALQNRAGVANWLRGAAQADERGDERPATALSSLRRRVADIWHVAAVLYVMVMFGIWVLEAGVGFDYALRASALTLVIFAGAWFCLTSLPRAIAKLFAVSDELKRLYPGLEDRANRYLKVLDWALRIVIYVIAALTLFEAWGIDAYAWLGTEFGRRASGAVIVTAVLVVGSVVIWEVANSMVERRLARLEESGGNQRLQTLLPLMRNALLVVLTVMVALIALSEFGVDIGPLLAGAGIAGLAVGFGAQTLVKDIITGVFILVEDQVSVGDVVTVGGHGGLVEAITIRTIRLRDLSGSVHVVPFSEVTTVVNMTKDYSRYVFEVGVAYREDTDEVAEALKQVGDEMMADGYYKNLILEPLEVLGVDSFADSAVIIKARITTPPIKQWEVGREFNRRMKKRFDELGIEIPFPHQTIYFGEDKSGAAPPARVAMEPAPAPRAKPPPSTAAPISRAASAPGVGSDNSPDAGD